MPNTYTRLLFHVVFSTKNRQRTLPGGHREPLYRCSMNIGNCSAKTAFRTTNDTWRDIYRATTWHTPTNESESAGCAALHPRLFEGDRYAVKEL